MDEIEQLSCVRFIEESYVRKFITEYKYKGVINIKDNFGCGSYVGFYNFPVVTDLSSV